MSRHLIFDCSDEHDTLTGVVEWTDETARQIWKLMRLAAENDAGATSVTAEFHFDVYEGNPLEDELEDNTFIIVDKFEPGDMEPLRWAFSRVSAFDGSFIFEFYAKHCAQPVHSQAYLNLKEPQIRQLFSSVV